MGRERFEKQMSQARSVRSNQSSERRSVRSESRSPNLSKRRMRTESQMTTTLSTTESSSTTKPVVQPGIKLTPYSCFSLSLFLSLCLSFSLTCKLTLVILNHAFNKNQGIFLMTSKCNLFFQFVLI
jgi:hypothetical protein